MSWKSTAAGEDNETAQSGQSYERAFLGEMSGFETPEKLRVKTRFRVVEPLQYGFAIRRGVGHFETRRGR